MSYSHIFIFTVFGQRRPRQDVQFLNLENDEELTRLSGTTDVIYSLIQADRLGKYFM